VAWRLADLDVEMDPGSAGRVHPQPDRVGGAGPLRCERAVHDGADLAHEVSGTHHFRDRLVFLPGERGGHLRLNGVPGNRRRFTDADMRAAASREPPSGCHRHDDGQNVPFAFEHAITPHVDHPEMHDIPSPGLPPAERRRPLTAPGPEPVPDSFCMPEEGLLLSDTPSPEIHDAAV